jgi:hypothetical protein
MRILWCVVALLFVGCDDDRDGGLQQQTGVGETIFAGGADPKNPFFDELGSNQRTCATCHDQEAAWSVTPAALQARFDASEGLDPIFRAVDGATSPRADVSTVEARLAAYDLLLTKGLVRVGMPIPADAEFTLTAVSDPYGFASATELSLFRRPLPSTNLRFMSTIMWDDREATLDTQARDATLGHAQAMSIETPEALAQIVGFESSIYTAQGRDDVAGDLADGAGGGARALVATAFAIGINDSASPGFDREAFKLYAGWANADTSTAQGQRRASIARGEQLFNTKRIRIRGVAGLPDQDGTCSTCHDTPSIGSHSVALPMDLGVSDARRRTSDLPLYTLTNKADGRTVRTSDPGYALVTGKWDDIGKFKVPALRGAVMRPPYFHNGMSDNLDEVLDFYRQRLDVDLSGREHDDLIAFLTAL